jgi:hypothetical protein
MGYPRVGCRTYMYAQSKQGKRDTRSEQDVNDRRLSLLCCTPTDVIRLTGQNSWSLDRPHSSLTRYILPQWINFEMEVISHKLNYISKDHYVSCSSFANNFQEIDCTELAKLLISYIKNISKIFSCCFNWVNIRWILYINLWYNSQIY